MSTFHNILTPDDDLQAVLDHSSPGDFIQLSEGDFRVKCTVFVPSLTIRGAGMDKTRIIWDDYATRTAKNTIPSAPGLWLSVRTMSPWKIWLS